MAHRMCSVVVVVATLVIALAAGSVRAQTNCGTMSDVRSDMAFYCSTYLQSPTMSTPDPFCCSGLSIVQIAYGSACWCQLYLTVNFAQLGANSTKACTLPRDCNVTADMTNCPACAGPSPPGSAIPPPGIPTPPSAGLLTPPAGLLTPPAAGFLTPPAGLTTTPPAFPAPTVPTFETPSTRASGYSARKSLALPIGASAGGLTGGGLIIGIIWRIVSRRRRTATEAPSHIPRKPVSDNYGDKVPASMNGYGV